MLNIVLFLLQLLPLMKTNQPSVATKDGVLFNLHQKILLTENFVKTEILVPYPIYNKTVEDKLINLTKEIDKMWTSENYGCPLNFTNMTDSTAGLHWIAQQTMIENQQAQHDIVSLKLEMNTLLRANSQTSTTLQRQPRGAAAAAAAVLGIGIGTGDKLLCFIKSVFGGCDKRVARNQKNIRQAMAYLQYLTDHVEQITIQNNEKFYVVSGQLKAIKEAQNETIETQNRNWELAEGQFKALRQNVHHMRNCIQYLYVREQINQHSLVLSNIFQAIVANIKTYRSALYTIRINILNALTPLMNQLLPMSLVPREQLHEILAIVHLQQNGQQDRLSLAVPIQEILSYYETKLVTQVEAIDAGLILTLAIPMASKSTVMNVLHAIPIPMPDGDTGKALVWRLEAKYMAVSDDGEELAFIDEDELANCIGSQKYAICTKAIPAEQTYQSCMATSLYHDDELLALQRCQLDVVELPLTEKARNLGFGRWLITSSKDDYTLIESAGNGSNPLARIEHPGCRVCIITLGCGKQLRGPNVHLRSDLTACDTVPAIRLDFQLPDPISTLFKLLPPLDELPNFSSRSEAQIQILQQIQPEFKQMETRRTNSKSIEQMAEPNLERIRAFKPELEHRFEQYIPWKMSLLFGFLSFLISVLLHLTYSHLLHKWAKLHRRFPFRITHEGRRIKTKPVQVVALNDYEYLQEHPEHPLHKCSLVLPLEIKTEFENQNEENINKPRTPYKFLRDYIRRLKRNEEPTIKIDHVNRPAAPSQPIYTHIPEHPPISHYAAYPLRTINTGNV